MKKGYHEGHELTIADLGLSMEELRGQLARVEDITWIGEAPKSLEEKPIRLEFLEEILVT